MKRSKERKNTCLLCVFLFSIVGSPSFQSPRSLGQVEKDCYEEEGKIGNEDGKAEVEKEIYKLVLENLKWVSVFLYRDPQTFGLWK